MSTTPTDPAPTPAPTPISAESPATGPAPVNPPPAPDAPAQDLTDWKAEARKWEARSKENAEAAKRLAEIEESVKTEAQKQADALAAAQAKVKEYETREQITAWKAEVSKETGVPVVALAGSTKEEIEAHAETLKPLIGTQQPTEPPRPGVVPTIGKTPATPPNIPLGQQIAAAEQARDQNPAGSPDWAKAQAQVMQLKGMQLFEAQQTVK